MRFLIEDIVPHAFDLRRANGERAVSVLPTEQPVIQFPMYPFRRCDLDLLNDIGQSMSRPQADQKMQVIGRAPNRDRSRI